MGGTPKCPGGWQLPRLFCLPLVVGLLACCGCGTPDYPPDLSYPPRADWLVVQAPTAPPTVPEEGGNLDAELARINSLGGRAYNPNTLPEDERGQIAAALKDLFGTPSAPTVGVDGEPRRLAEQLGLQPERLAEGSRLFRRHCLQCHGIVGDGRGPTGPWIFPHPRDFRQGLFKWVSTGASGGGRPTRDDLVRTIRRGIEGTSMPSFGLLSAEATERLAEYVMHLSLRGEVEYRLLLALLTDGPAGLEGDVAEAARERLDTALRQWLSALAGVLEPVAPASAASDDGGSEADAESVRRGYRLFAESQAAGCATCHEDFGRQAKARFDVWGMQVRPANLTEKVYHGGGDPLDLYRRVRGGIFPSGMPAATSLSDGQAWDVVHFVQALPFPRMLPPDVREKVYPPRDKGRRLAGG